MNSFHYRNILFINLIDMIFGQIVEVRLIFIEKKLGGSTGFVGQLLYHCQKLRFYVLGVCNSLDNANPIGVEGGPM